MRQEWLKGMSSAFTEVRKIAWRPEEPGSALGKRNGSQEMVRARTF